MRPNDSRGAWNDVFQQLSQSGDIPLAVAQFVKMLPLESSGLVANFT
jgi:hypothetical protein